MTFRYATKKPDGTICCAGNDENFPRCRNCKGATLPHSYAPPHSYNLAAHALPRMTADSHSPYAPPSSYGLKETR